MSKPNGTKHGTPARRAPLTEIARPKTPYGTFPLYAPTMIAKQIPAVDMADFVAGAKKWAAGVRDRKPKNRVPDMPRKNNWDSTGDEPPPQPRAKSLKDAEKV